MAYREVKYSSDISFKNMTCYAAHSKNFIKKNFDLFKLVFNLIFGFSTEFRTNRMIRFNIWFAEMRNAMIIFHDFSL